MVNGKINTKRNGEGLVKIFSHKTHMHTVWDPIINVCTIHKGWFDIQYLQYYNNVSQSRNGGPSANDCFV